MIPNLRTVSDELNIWRGGQPVTEQDWQLLKDKGIVAVIKANTEAEGSDAMATALGMELSLYPIPWYDQIIPGLDHETVVQNLIGASAFIREGTFIHCGSVARTQAATQPFDKQSGGNDRTGAICGLYRVRTGWGRQKAWEEMLADGFHFELANLLLAWRDAVKRLPT